MTYERLSFLDTSFLALESRETHMHVGGVALFEGAPIRGGTGGLDFGAIRSFVESRLHLVPRYRHRLAWVPVEHYPVWVDDHAFDLDYHLRHTSIPRPGSEQQLRDLAGRIFSQQLDRNRPLWELWFVEGVQDDRFALIAKIHHSMIDGISAVDLMAAMLGLSPESDIIPPEPWEPRPTPSGAELVAGEAGRRLRALFDRTSSARSAVEEGQEAVGRISKKVAAALSSLSSGWLTRSTDTPLNDRIGPNRRFGWTDVDLATVKNIKNSAGGSVNDVVLAAVAGAMRRFLTEHRQFDVEGIDYRVMAPVSVRSRDQRGQLGNQVAMWLLHLPLAEADPLARLKAVTRETMRLKRTDQALGASTLVQMSSGTPVTLVSLGVRLAADRKPFNMTVTNVPGPQFPLYLLESRMLAQYPMVPLWQHHGVGIALFSYLGKVAWGINADWDLLPDLDEFIVTIHDSVDELANATFA